MLTLRKSADRGFADHGWLQSRHSFSFADYHDPQQMGFGPLRVINEDWIAAGKGFGTHPHRDMEIVTYVLAGEIAHKDSMGNGTAIRPDEVQRMSAGRGVMHSEFNPSTAEPTHMLQIWILPDVQGVAPSYEQTRFDPVEKRGRLRLVADAEGREGAVRIHSSARLYAGLFDGIEQADFPLPAGRLAYVHVARGQVQVNGVTLGAGDAAKLQGEASVHLDHGIEAEVLLFDLPS
jgi:redox-sensitive bicupin YhaK (pirin superfamily)